MAERSTLLAKNEQARSRVEAMISRLKSLEQHMSAEPVSVRILDREYTVGSAAMNATA